MLNNKIALRAEHLAPSYLQRVPKRRDAWTYGNGLSFSLSSWLFFAAGLVFERPPPDREIIAAQGCLSPDVQGSGLRQDFWSWSGSLWSRLGCRSPSVDLASVNQSFNNRHRRHYRRRGTTICLNRIRFSTWSALILAFISTSWFINIVIYMYAYIYYMCIINRSVNLSINHSINQSISQSPNQSIIQSSNQSVSQSINRSVVQLNALQTSSQLHSNTQVK